MARRQSTTSYDLRDEGLLRLFFGELMSHEAAARARAQTAFGGFPTRASNSSKESPRSWPIEGPSAEVLRYGLDLMAWSAAWWAELETRLLETTPSSPQSGA